MNDTLLYANALKNSRAFHLISNDFNLGLGHAYMVISPDDDAIAEFFRVIACAVYCDTKNACFECPSCQQVLHFNHPDVKYINDDRQRLKVETVRDVLSDVNIKSLTGHKLYFVQRADLMDKVVQNKLLKTLEEPPKEVTFFLGVANESAMLDTVKSRCRHIALDSFPQDVIVAELKRMNVEDNLAAVAALCSEGQLGKAHKIALSGDYATLYTAAVSLLGGLKRSPDVARFDNMKEAQKNPIAFLEVLSTILRDMLVFKHNPDLVVSGHIREDISALADTFSERAAAEAVFAINQAKRKLLAPGANALAVTDAMLFSILEVKHKWQLS